MKINHYISISENVKSLFLFTFFLCLLFPLGTIQAQKEQEKILKEADAYLSSAETQLKDDQFSLGEADYRKAIALNPKDETGKYNLGNAYYGKEFNETAMERFKQAAAIATDKPNKHKAFHNLGNTYMNEKKYQEAVEAYKNALRNNPTDDETRYNFALAKKMLEEQKDGDGEGDDKEKDSKDDSKDEQNKDNKDQNKEEEKDKEEKNEGDEGDEGDKEEEEKEDKGDQKDEEKEGDKEKENGQPEDKKEEKEQQQPVPGKLSPQQIKSLLEAMNNEEKKIQDKINAKKQKGPKVKSNKDW